MYSSVRPFVYVRFLLFVYSFVCSSVYSFVCLFIPSFVYLFVRSFVYSSVVSLVYSFLRWLFCLFLCAFVCLSVPSFLYSLTHVARILDRFLILRCLRSNINTNNVSSSTSSDSSLLSSIIPLTKLLTNSRGELNYNWVWGWANFCGHRFALLGGMSFRELWVLVSSKLTFLSSSLFNLCQNGKK